MANSGIGSLNESSMHTALKGLYAPPSRSELAVRGYIVDSRQGDRLVEIQTSSFAKIRKKLAALLAHHDVLLVFPVAREKTICVYDADMKNMLYRRKSPKKGELLDVAYELVHIADLLSHPRFSLEVLITREEEVRAADGRGSWRRRGISIVDRRLEEVLERRVFESRKDYRSLLPETLGPVFTNRELAETMGTPVEKVRRLTYCLKRCGVIEVAGQSGRTQQLSLSKEFLS